MSKEKVLRGYNYLNLPPSNVHIYEPFSNAYDFRSAGEMGVDFTSPLISDSGYFYGNIVDGKITNKRGKVFTEYVEASCDFYLYFHVKGNVIIMIDSYPKINRVGDTLLEIGKRAPLLEKVADVLKCGIDVNGITILYMMELDKIKKLDKFKYNLNDYKFYTDAYKNTKNNTLNIQWFTMCTMAGYNCYSFDNFVELTKKAKSVDFLPSPYDRVSWSDDWFRRDIDEFKNDAIFTRYVKSIRLCTILLVLTEKEHGIKNSFVYALINNTFESYLSDIPRKLVIDFFQAIPGSGGSGSASIEYLYKNYTNIYKHKFCVDCILSTHDYDEKWQAGSFWEKMYWLKYCSLTRNARDQIYDTMKRTITAGIEDSLEDLELRYVGVFPIRERFRNGFDDVINDIVDDISNEPNKGNTKIEGIKKNPPDEQEIVLDSGKLMNTEMKCGGNGVKNEIEVNRKNQSQKGINKYQSIKNIKSKIKNL